MKEKEQSSIEWLIEELILKDRENNPNSFAMQIYFKSHNELIKQAKQLHKKEIIEAYKDGRSDQQSDKKDRFYKIVGQWLGNFAKAKMQLPII